MRIALCAALSATGFILLPAGATSTRVRAEVAGEPLSRALPPIGESGGAALRCGPNAAGHRLFIYADEVPLEHLAARLRAFVPRPPGIGLWYREGGFRVFDEDLASVAARRRATRDHQAAEVRMRRAALARMEGWLTMPSTNPGAQSREHLGDFLRIFRSLPAGAQRAGLAGYPLRVPFSDLGAQGRSMVRRWMAGMGTVREGRENEAFVGARDYGRVVVEVSPSGTPERPGLRVRLRNTQNAGVQVKDILNPPQWDPQSGWTWDHHYKSYRERRRGPKDGERIPDLQARITLAGGGGAFVEKVLAELSRDTGRPILGEYDPCYAAPYAREGGYRVTLAKDAVREAPVWKALNVVCARFDLDWDYREQWILIRSPRTRLSWAGLLDLSPPGEAEYGAPK